MNNYMKSLVLTPRLQNKALTLNTRKTFASNVPKTEVNVVPNSQTEFENDFQNKSRLHGHHYKILHDLPQPFCDVKLKALPLGVLRKRLVNSGRESNVSVSYHWPSKEELELQKEYEKVLYPDSLPDMIRKAKEEKLREAEEIRTTQEQIRTKLKELNKWKKELNDKRSRKEEEAMKAQALQQRRIDEVRQIFGYNIDPNDPRFQEALAKKEAEEAKAKKAARKLEKQKKMIEELKKQATGQVELNTPEDKLYGKSISKDSLQPPLLGKKS